jgi:hypothetical protein
MHCAVKVKTHAVGATSTTRPADIAGDITIENVVVRADAREAAGVDHIAIKVDTFNGSAAELASVLIDGVRAAAERTAAGDLRVAGLEVVAAPAAAAPPTAKVTQSSSSSSSTASPALTQPALRDRAAARAQGDTARRRFLRYPRIVRTLTLHFLSGVSPRTGR